MKNALLLVLFSITLLFSCKKDDAIINPDYAGRYASNSILVSSSSNYFVQYNAIVVHNITTNKITVSIYENYRNVQSNGLAGSLADTYTYYSPTLQINESKATINAMLSATNRKGASVGSAVFDGSITYSSTDMIYRGMINGKSIILVLAKLATTTVVKSDDGW